MASPFFLYLYNNNVNIIRGNADIKVKLRYLWIHNGAARYRTLKMATEKVIDFLKDYFFVDYLELEVDNSVGFSLFGKSPPLLACRYPASKSFFDTVHFVHF